MMSKIDTTRPTHQWGDIDDDNYLADLDYNFEGYFERFHNNQVTDEERGDFSARVYGLFCRDFYKSGGDPAYIKPWVASYIADKLFQVLQGAPWSEIMGMPWDTGMADQFTPRGKRAFDIYAGVRNALNRNPTANVTDLINAQAVLQSVSYQTARGDYYALRNSIERGEGIPKKFLKNEYQI